MYVPLKKDDIIRQFKLTDASIRALRYIAQGRTDIHAGTLRSLRKKHLVMPRHIALTGAGVLVRDRIR
jgi:hypothetical protein